MISPRRDFLKFAALLAAPVPAQSNDGIKIAHRITYKGLTDDDLLFFQQIGLEYARVEFGEGEDVSLDALRTVQQRFSKFGMKIFSGVHYSYRTTRLQLGQPGRDQDIEIYQKFLRNLGKL